jgi:hypothetical protein
LAGIPQLRSLVFDMWKDSLLASTHHIDASLRTHVNAKTTTVTFIALNHQFPIVHLPGTEVTHLHALTAIVAIFFLSLFDQVSFIAFVLSGV